MKITDRRILTERILICILGNAIIGLGVAVAKIADLGIDPFNGMTMSVAGFLGIDYMVFTWAFNLLCFAAEILWGRKYINIGTFINWFLVSFAVTIFLNLYAILDLPFPSSMAARIPVLIIAVIVMSLGVALYQFADLGIAPFDVIPIMFCDRHPKFPYFWARIILDSAAVLGIILTGSGLIGVGTLITALGLGPIVHFFMYRLKKRYPHLVRSSGGNGGKSEKTEA